MKKPFKQVLAILVINIVVHGLVILALLLLLEQGDPVLAAIPAIVALPVILLQPWYVIFSMIPCLGVFIAPFATTAVSAPIFILLERSGRLDWAKRLVTRLKNWRTAVVASAVCVCVAALCVSRYVDYPAWHRGIPHSLQKVAQEMGLILGNSRYYCLGRFVDQEWLWQTRMSESDLNNFADRLRMQPIPVDGIPDQYWDMPPYWWRPVLAEQTRVLSTKNFPAGEGLQALATWTPGDEVLYMWVKENF
jgi:hypothetical protein